MNRDLHMPYSTVSFRMTLSEASHGLSVTAVLLVLVRLLGNTTLLIIIIIIVLL